MDIGCNWFLEGYRVSLDLKGILGDTRWILGILVFQVDIS